MKHLVFLVRKVSVKDVILVSVVALFLFVLANFIAFHIIKMKLQVSIYESSQYLELKARFLKDPKWGQFPHPFFGSAVTGWKSADELLTREPLFDTISSSRTDSIKVLILGGSVARQLSNFPGSEANIFAEVLNKKFGADRFVVYNGAMGGGKQPQQYFKYLYLDLLDFRPDIVINVDGVNEINLPLAENLPRRIPASFPRSYSGLVRAASGDRSCAKRNNSLLRLDSNIPLVELFVWLYVRHCHKTIEGDLNSIPWWSWMGQGDHVEAYVKESVSVWKSSSNKLNSILESRGIHYIHVVQPSPYLDGSKVLTDEEKVFLTTDIFESYGIHMKEFYGHLNGETLATKNFLDLRFLFKSFPDTVYSDAAGHFNQLGNKIISEQIVERNIEIFRSKLKLKN